MSLVLDLAYAVGGILAGPFLLRKSWRTGKYRSGLVERLGFGEEPVPEEAKGGEKTLLLHCVSVGEVNSVGTLVQRLLAADTGLRIILTTGTDTGTERARKLYGVGTPGNPPAATPVKSSTLPALQARRPTGASAPLRVFPVRFPFDFSFAVERLLDRVRPDAVALVELETWPNFLEIAADRRVPVAIINGRISERSYPRYRLIRPVMAGMLRRVSWIGAQTEAIAGRFRRLGGGKEGGIEVVPTLKYDNALVAEEVAGQKELAAAIGLTAGQRLVVAGSTGPGEEGALVASYGALRERNPELRLAIVPRHPEVVAQVVAAVRAAGLVAVRRTERMEGVGPALKSEEVLVLDTMGELRKMYGLALGVFVGRSLLKKGGGGSDMIEVAALGKACCFGPFTANFAEVVELLVGQGVAVEVADGAGLTRVWEGWLQAPAEAAATGRRAQELIRQQQARRATDRYVERLLQLVREGRDRA